MLAPVCLFTYNRLNETQKTIQALQNNILATESELYIFSDGFKNKNEDKLKVEAVRRYIEGVNGFKSVTIMKSIENKGLARSVIEGITLILNKYDNVIVLEDDLVTSPNCLNFLNKALDFYKNEANIQSICAFSLSLENKNREIYFQTRPGSWGWATWKDCWNPAIFNKENLKTEISQNKKLLKQFKLKCGADMPKMLMDSIADRNDSWYVRWAYSHFKQNQYSVFPAYSYIENIGHQLDATHCKGINSYNSIPVDSTKTEFYFPDFNAPDNKTTNDFLNYFSLHHKVAVRLKLLKNNSGRAQLIQELKSRLMK